MIFTAKFWKATAERMVRGGAIAVGTLMGLDGGGLVAHVSPQDAAVAFVYGAAGSLVLCLIGGKLGAGDGPAIAGQEQVDR